MPENTDTPDDLEAPPTETPEAAADTTTSADDAADTGGNREAARFRVERNQARAERDAAIAQVQALQRSIIDGLCENAAVQPRALWLTTELSDLVNDDGTVDRTAVNAAIEKARQELGIHPVAKGAYVPNAGKMPTTPPATDRWADAFSPKNRRANG
ncbi:hypothetical protein [Gordonia paraffinivorans]|uniref:hypothetical protein n=1 Tax=Gordonia paraffinivorans TaxID=175628 RepID=UPI0014489D6A|nr:hypothetical protein [Gordonia paraffinivorans]